MPLGRRMTRGPLPTVAHVMHAYLGRTETFVHNQMASLTRYRPVVVAHHLRAGNLFHYDCGVTAADVLPGALARADAALYRGARLTLPVTTRRLASWAVAQRAVLLHYHFVVDARFLRGVKRRTGLPAVVSAYGYDVSLFPRRWHGLGG